MSKLLKAVGHIYGRLSVLETVGVVNRKQVVLAQCSCGNQIQAPLTNLRSGNTLSCGCLRKESTAKRVTKHGMRKTRLYRVYTAMLQRCQNPKDRSYPNYGGRGIYICEEWLKGFDYFLNWTALTGYTDFLEIERKDVNLGYSPENCVWATNTTQARNRRTRKHSSIYTGVHQRTSTGKWEASITVNKKRIYLGKFNSQEEAWLTRCEYIKQNNLKDFQMNI